MFRKGRDVTPLESRKQLLILESELNRALLMKEVSELKGEVHKMAQQARGMGSIISTISDLAGTVATVGHAFTSRNKNGKQHSWISTVINTARAGASIWQVFRARRK